MEKMSTNERMNAIQEALGYIAEKEREAMVMGANDFEASQSFFNQIRQQVQEGEISPEEGKQRAHDVVEGKQDYH